MTTPSVVAYKRLAQVFELELASRALRGLRERECGSATISVAKIFVILPDNQAKQVCEFTHKGASEDCSARQIFDLAALWRRYAKRISSQRVRRTNVRREGENGDRK